MANNTIGFYFDRFRVLVGGQDFARKPGNVASVSISQDGGVSWIDGFSADHMPSGILKANTHTVFRITENLEYNVIPIAYDQIDYSAAEVNINLIMPTSQYSPDVYEGGAILQLKSVAWDSTQTAAAYANNTKRDLMFFVVGGANWLDA